jgi:hypothetical protein
MPKTFLSAGEIEPVDTAVVGADESLFVNVAMTESLDEEDRCTTDALQPATERPNLCHG